MEFRVLGPLEVRDDRGPLTIPGIKERLLLARLLVDVDRTVGVEALVEELWADHPPRTAAKSLQTFVARLRAVLDPAHSDPGSLLRFDQSGYRLAVPPAEVDAERFQELLAAGRSAAADHRPDAARSLLTDALALWRGPALAELADGSFGRAEAYRLEGLRASAVENLAAADLALGDRDAAVAALERLLVAQPFRESAAVLLMTSLHDDGRAADALAVYDRIRRRLADDLGLEPGAELVAVHGQVLRRRPAGRPTERWARMIAVDRVRAASGAVGAGTRRLDRRRQDLRDGIIAAGELDIEDVADPARCPWRGLQRYEIEDGPWFAGRERLVAELLTRLAGARVLAIVGPSGSGKSSVLRAGLLASLAGGALPGSADWTATVMRPSGDPLGAVADLLEIPPESRSDEAVRMDAVLLRGLTDPSGPRRVIAIDQAEELWTGGCDPTVRARFLDLLAAAATDERATVTVVVVIRPDYLGELAGHTTLAHVLTDRIVLVPPPTPGEIVRAVERPAGRAGLRCEDGLTDAVVADAGAEPGLLPLVSTAMTRVWEARSGSVLTLAGYLRAGGLVGAIAGLAEEVFTGLDPVRRRTVRVVLLRLCAPGLATTVVRRRVPRAELLALPDPHVGAVVERLAAARLITVSSGWVEVAHEVLFQRWPRLAGWIAEDAAVLAFRQRLAIAARAWDDEDRDGTLVWQGPRLQAATDLADASPAAITAVERAFLDAGRTAADVARRRRDERAAATARQNRRLRRLLGGVIGLLVVAVVAGGLAVAAQRRATAAGDAADARRLAAQAVTEQHLDVGLLGAVEAVRAEPGADTWGALLALLTRAPALMTQVHAEERFLSGAAGPAGDVVYLAENLPRVTAVDAATGAQRWSAQQPTMPGRLAADPQGRGVLTYLGFAPTLLDARTGRVRWQVAESTLADAVGNPGFGLAWLPDGRWLAAGQRGLFVGDGDSGASVSTVAFPTPMADYPDTIVVDRDGRVRIGGSAVGRAASQLLVDLDTGITGSREQPGTVVAASSTGMLAVYDGAAPARPQVRLLAADGRTPVTSISAPQFGGGVAFSPDGDLLAVGTSDRVELRDGRTGELRDTLVGHSGTVMSLLFPDATGNVLWSVGRDGSAMSWDLRGRHGAVQRFVGANRASLGDTADRGDVAVGLVQGVDATLNTVDLLDPRSGTVRRSAVPLGPGCRWCDPTSVAISADGALAVAGYEDFGGPDGQAQFPARPDRGWLGVWSVDRDEPVGLVDLPWPVFGVDMASDPATGAPVALVQGSTGAAVVDLTSRRIVAGPWPHGEIPDRDATGTAAISGDGRLGAVSLADGVEIRDLSTGIVRATIRLDRDDTVSSLGWSPGGDRLAIGTYGGRLSVADTATGALLVRDVQVTGGWLLGTRFIADGRFLATLGTDGDLLLWDTADWRALGRPLEDDAGWGWLATDPDGRTLRVVHADGTVFAIAVDPDAWVAQACRIAGRDLTADEWSSLLPGRTPRSTCGYDDN